MDAANIVAKLLESDEGFDAKSFLARNFKALEEPSKKHLFVSSTDGGLYDTRNKNWHEQPPLRQNYQKFHREISTPEEFKATWRARHYSNYPLAFWVADGELLCEQCVKDNFRRILSSIRNGAGDGWRVTGVTNCYGSQVVDPEEPHAECANCNKVLGEVD
jgi:hypothetical protein